MQNHLDERGRRVWAASEAQSLGHGGVTILHEATGMSRSAITQGIAEMARPQDAAPPDRARMFGGGRKKTVGNIQDMSGNWKAFLIHRWQTVLKNHCAMQAKARINSQTR
jgi:hypothetical protein